MSALKVMKAKRRKTKKKPTRKVTNDLSIFNTNRPDLVMLTEQEFCHLTGQKLSTVRSNRIKGKGCHFYKIGGLVRYKLSEALNYIESCKRTSTTVEC